MDHWRILVVDDDGEARETFRLRLGENGYEVSTACSGGEALALLKQGGFEFALVNLKLPDIDGLFVLREIKLRDPVCEVLVMTDYGTVGSAIDAMRLGAVDYIEKPLYHIDQIESIIDQARTSTGKTPIGEINKEFGFVIGRNPEMRRIVYVAQRIADKNMTVLIQGETGTGKEVIARFIHNMSQRANHPFVAVNCGAFTETILESELFGHEKGSFTGASGLRRGVFELANHGTLFLDEVGAASQSIQVKLLRVLETGEFFRVGGEQPQKTDVRIIAATNVDLREEVARKNFRSDLFYRLDSVSMYIPSLRERKEDIPTFLKFLLKKHGIDSTPSKVMVRVSPEALEILMQYHWPGNVRELANVINNALAVAEADVILPNHLPHKLFDTGKLMPKEPKEASPSDAHERIEDLVLRCARDISGVYDVRDSLPFREALKIIRSMEKHAASLIMQKVLRHTMGDYKRSAELLGITPRTVRYYLKERASNTKLLPKKVPSYRHFSHQ